MRVTDGLLARKYHLLMMRIGIVFVVTLLLGSLAFAERGEQQQPCRQGSRCDIGLECVKHSDGNATCEKRCKSGRDCPEDQRCVLDGGAMVCRPSIDLNAMSVQPQR
jgi:hypothetical protein